ncbi:MAG: ABC transporter permease [Deinococcota bacterium]|jgi:peptide/nickel transport system permease protein|nr:ABC transporter permease [Deinococcota bacterium]
MLVYILRRLILVVVVVWGAATLAFGLLYLSGDPINLLVPLDATPEVRAAFRRAYGFDQPVWVQYGRYLQQAVQGDFGTSLRSDVPALPLVLERMPASLLLAGSGLLFAVLLGIPAGVVAALKRGTPTELGVMSVALMGQSIPVFWLGLMLILVFGLELRWLPISGYGSWQHLVLPTVTIGTFTAAAIARLTRNGVLQELRSDYVRTARAKGNPGRTIVYKHALRNAAIPVITVIGLQLGTLLSGAVITETIFAWPGLGRFVLIAVSQRDFPVVQAAVIVFALLLALVNLLVDLSYVLLDPRVRYS